MIVLPGVWHWNGGADYGIRVNGIAPGPIDGTTGLNKLTNEEMIRKLEEFDPLFKLGEKWDIAMAALSLASDAEVEISPLVSYTGENPEAICRGRTFHAPSEITF